jgi:hypothetical protein
MEMASWHRQLSSLMSDHAASLEDQGEDEIARTGVGNRAGREHTDRASRVNRGCNRSTAEEAQHTSRRNTHFLFLPP